MWSPAACAPWCGVACVGRLVSVALYAPMHLPGQRWLLLLVLLISRIQHACCALAALHAGSGSCSMTGPWYVTYSFIGEKRRGHRLIAAWFERAAGVLLRVHPGE